MNDNIIKVPFGKKRKKDEPEDTPDDQITSVLLCAGCGNSLFLMLMMDDGDIASVCQHCQLEFGFTNDGEAGIVVQEDYEEIGITPPDDENTD